MSFGDARSPEFLGDFTQTIDSKGRMALPAVHRSHYAAGVWMLVRGDFLAVYEANGWNTFMSNLRARKDAGEFTRSEFDAILRIAHRVNLDSAGRILIPAQIRERLRLNGEVHVSGADDYLSVFAQRDPKTLAAAEASGLSKLDALGL